MSEENLNEGVVDDDITAVKLAIADLDDALDELESAVDAMEPEDIGISVACYADAVNELNRALKKVWANDRPPTPPTAGEES